MIIFTSICANYLAKARALAKSVKANIPDATFVLCLVEKDVPAFLKPCAEFDEVILTKDIGFANFNRFIFLHSIVEASTAVKAQAFKHLFERFPQEDKFVYLDPDILVYSDVSELRSLLDTESIVLCPHLLVPGNVDMEVSCLQHGSYNLGFLALRRSATSSAFLDWWAERLLWFCYDDIPHGIFTDQKWIDLAPSFFDVYILKNRGYDFATWSLKDSRMSVRDGRYYVADDELRFIHFSGFDSKTVDWAIRQWMTDQPDSPFIPLYEGYQDTLKTNGQDAVGRHPWSYDDYSSGKKVSKKIRKWLRKAYEIQFSVENPFSHSDFFFFRKLLLQKVKNYQPLVIKKAFNRLKRTVKSLLGR